MPAGDEPVRMLLDPQIGAVGVRADDPEWDLRVPALLGVPRHQRASPDGEVPARFVRPAIRFAQLAVSGAEQPSRHRRADVKRRRGRVDEFAQAVCRGRHVAMSSITGIAGTLGSWLCLLSLRSRFWRR